MARATVRAMFWHRLLCAWAGTFLLGAAAALLTAFGLAALVVPLVLAYLLAVGAWVVSGAWPWHWRRRA